MMRVKFILSSNSNCTEFISVTHVLTCENADVNVSKNINVQDEISIKIPNGLLCVNV